MLLERLLVVIDVYQICWLVETDVECLLPGEDLASVLITQLRSNQYSALPKYVIYQTWLISNVVCCTHNERLYWFYALDVKVSGVYFRYSLVDLFSAHFRCLKFSCSLKTFYQDK